MIPARPLYQRVGGSVWDPEPSKERVGDWGGPAVCSLLCVAETRATRPNGEWGYSSNSTRRHMLGHECPGAVSPARGVVLTNLQSSICLSINFSLSPPPPLLQPHHAPPPPPGRTNVTSLATAFAYDHSRVALSRICAPVLSCDRVVMSSMKATLLNCSVSTIP